MALLLWLLPAPAPGQFTLPAGELAARDSALTRVVGTLPDAKYIRVALMRSRWSGTYMGSRGDTIFLGVPDQPPMGLRFNAVDTLWRAHSAAKRGAWIGGISGLVLGAVAGATFLYEAEADAVPGYSSGVSDFNAGVTALGAVSGAAIGALVGAAIGAPIRRWKRIYP